MSQIYVSPFLFACLAASGVGNAGTLSIAGQVCGGKAFRVFGRLCEAEKHLHEDQFCKRRPRSRVNRFANKSFHRGSHAVVQGRLITLDQREKSGRGQVWLGTRLRRILCFGVRRRGSLRLHFESGGTPSETGFCRGIKIVRRTIRAGVAQRLKPLKRFPFTQPICTPLRRGVNESRNRANRFVRARELK